MSLRISLPPVFLRSASRFRLFVVIVALVPSLLVGFGVRESAGQASNPPVNPPAEKIDPKLLQEAVRHAVANGIGSLMARQLATTHESDLIFPPRSERKRIGNELAGERRFRRVVRTENIYERQFAERLMPQRDEYGSITGYRTVRVEVGRRKVGERQVERIVPDPEGDIVRPHYRPVWDPEGLEHYPRGFFGLNGMALYVLSRAGVGDESFVRNHALELAELIESDGIPDHTWDLAWLVAGFVHFPGDAADELVDRMISKLIDGQVRDRGDGAGLWGPVSIHYTHFAQALDADFSIAARLKQIEDALEAIPEQITPQIQRQITQLQSERMQLEETRGRLAGAMSTIATHAWRLERSTRTMEIEDKRYAALTYYVFNRVLADIEATSVAAFALEQAALTDRLPQTTQRMTINRRPLAAPENTNQSLTNSLNALARLQQTNGGWNEHNSIQSNATFDRLRSDLFRPAERGLPTLIRHETIESNLRGASALASLLRAMPAAATQRFEKNLESAEQRAAAALNRILEQPHNFTRWPQASSGLNTPVARLSTRGGQVIQIPQHPLPRDLPVEELNFGTNALPYRAIETVSSMFRPISRDDETMRNEELFRRLAYRLLVTQAEDGQWVPRETRALGVTTSEIALRLHGRAADLVSRVQRGRSEAETFEHQAETQRAINDGLFRSDGELYGTLVAISILIEGIGEEPIDLEEVPVLSAEAEAAVDDPDAEPLSPTQAARSTQRPNPALTPLLEAIGGG